jgi:hypothetical protein
MSKRIYVSTREGKGFIGSGTCQVEGIWNAFAECNFWFRNLNKTPLVFLKPSSQVNNFTVFFHFFMGMSKSVFSICLG